MKPWTDAHRREALRRTYEIAAEFSGDRSRSLWLAYIAAGIWEVTTEADWRAALAQHSSAGARGLDPARINHEVRRVRGLADGRLVRSEERGYRIASPGGGRSNVCTKQEALDSIAAAGPVSRATRVAVPVRRVTIRRVQP